MSNKAKVISIRVSNNEYSILESNSQKLNMSISEYIRSQINSVPTIVPDQRQKISSIMCRLYILLKDHGLEDESIAKEVAQLCQM